MRRMSVHPKKVIECSFKNDGRMSIVDVPFKSINDLPVSFDLIFSSTNKHVNIIAWFSPYNGEVYGEGDFLSGPDGNVLVSAEAGSLYDPGIPYLELFLTYENTGNQTPPLSENTRVFATNITQLEQGVIEVYH